MRNAAGPESQVSGSGKGLTQDSCLLIQTHSNCAYAALMRAYEDFNAQQDNEALESFSS